MRQMTPHPPADKLCYWIIGDASLTGLCPLTGGIILRFVVIDDGYNQLFLFTIDNWLYMR